MNPPSQGSKYKKYILFQWDSYDAAGGLRDIRGSFDALADAQEFASQKYYDSTEVVDRDTWELVWKKGLE